MKNSHPIIIVVGKDKKGIVANVTSFLAKNDINIEEIRQGIMDGNFFMVMSIDLTESELEPQYLRTELKSLGKKLDVEISVYNKDIFSYMNKI